MFNILQTGVLCISARLRVAPAESAQYNINSCKEIPTTRKIPTIMLLSDSAGAPGRSPTRPADRRASYPGRGLLPPGAIECYSPRDVQCCLKVRP